SHFKAVTLKAVTSRGEKKAGAGASAARFCFRNLLVNLGLFAAGVWVARNLTDIDLMAPQPGP
uniref:Translocase of outer mitochondrial membrane 6 n=1 Tax=Athene cunicularia TaxID=194338 RepID=A0A663MBP2_ATHCN